MTVLRPLALIAAAVCVAGGIGLATAADRTAPQRTPPLRPVGDCLVRNQVLDWGIVDDRRLVVRTLGSRYYDIRLSHRCRALSHRPLITFGESFESAGWRRGGFDPVGSDGRICGDLGDAVVPRSGYRGWGLGMGRGDLFDTMEIPCPIASIRRIDGGVFEGVMGRDSADANRMLDAAPSLLRPQR